MDLLNKTARNIIGNNLTVTQSGFVDTFQGCVLKSHEALAAERKAMHDKEKRDTAALERPRRYFASTVRHQKRLEILAVAESFMWRRRASNLVITVEKMKKRTRSIPERRATARYRAEPHRGKMKCILSFR